MNTLSDESLRDALLALSKFSAATLEGHIAVVKLIAQRMPGLLEAERELLLKANEGDKHRLRALQDALARIPH